MFYEIDIKDMEQIVEIFNEDNLKETDYWIDMGRFFIKGDYCELMLRFNIIQKRITIARINFQHTRKGYGTRLLKELITFAKRNQFETIYLESVMTYEFQCFALKNGFINIDDHLRIVNDYCLNWELKVF